MLLLILSINVFICGSFCQSNYFPGLTTLFGYSDIFLAKMDLNGNFIWAKKAGGLWFEE
jgi:hypothetical protein